MSSFPLRRSSRIAAKAIRRELATRDAIRASRPVEPLRTRPLRRSARLAEKAASRDFVESRFPFLNKREQDDLAISNLTPAKMREISQSAQWFRYLLNEMEEADIRKRKGLFIKFINELIEDHALLLAVIAKFRKTIELKIEEASQPVMKYSKRWGHTYSEVDIRMIRLRRNYFNFCHSLKYHSSYRTESDLPYPWNAEICPTTHSVLYRDMFNGTTQMERPLLKTY